VTLLSTFHSRKADTGTSHSASVRVKNSPKAYVKTYRELEEIGPEAKRHLGRKASKQRGAVRL